MNTYDHLCSQGSAASPGHYGNAGKISIPVETVPSVNISHTALPLHRNDSQSTCSPPSEGTIIVIR